MAGQGVEHGLSVQIRGAPVLGGGGVVISVEDNSGGNVNTNSN